MPTPLEEIKGKIDIVDFIRSYISLQPAGKNFKAPCPFHQEKTPSFIVSPEKQIWHCFGCQKGGDVIKFLMLYENLEFYEALRVLAEKAGVELKRLNLADQKEFSTLYELNEKAKNFYKEQLAKFPEPSAYLKKRGLKPETIEEFELGFAPAGGENLILYLVNLGYNINDIAKAGLAIKTDKGKYLDRFYGRIMFPIYNNFGKVVAFTGRILPSLESSDVGKYVNSPETPLFNKSRVLYGFHKAKAEISKTQSAFIVEGQMDFLMAWQSGVKNAVAVSGTALGQDQMKNLKRLADTLIVSFDRDEAGIKALERSLNLLNDFDFNIKVIDLNGFKDPAEAAEKDPAYLETALGKTRPAFVPLFDFYLGANHEWTVKKRNLRHLLEQIKSIKSAIEQAHWLKELAIKSGIGENVLTYELAAIKTRNSGSGEAEETKNGGLEKLPRLELLCRKIFSLIMFKPDFLPAFAANRDYFPENWQKFLDKPSALADDLLELRSSYEFSGFDDAALQKESQELARQLKIEAKKHQGRQLQEKIKSGQENNEENLDDLKKLQNLSQEINNLKNSRESK